MFLFIKVIIIKNKLLIYNVIKLMTINIKIIFKLELLTQKSINKVINFKIKKG